jgi:hypothetical protein
VRLAYVLLIFKAKFTSLLRSTLTLQGYSYEKKVCKVLTVDRYSISTIPGHIFDLYNRNCLASLYIKTDKVVMFAVTALKQNKITKRSTHC